MLNGCPSTKKSSESSQCLLTKAFLLETSLTFADTLDLQPQVKQEKNSEIPLTFYRVSIS